MIDLSFFVLQFVVEQCECLSRFKFHRCEHCKHFPLLALFLRLPQRRNQNQYTCNPMGRKSCRFRMFDEERNRENDSERVSHARELKVQCCCSPKDDRWCWILENRFVLSRCIDPLFISSYLYFSSCSVFFLGTVEEQDHRRTMIRENKQNGQERSDENETGRLFRPFWSWLLSSLEW